MAIGLKRVCSACGKDIKIDDVLAVEIIMDSVVYVCTECTKRCSQKHNTDGGTVLDCLGIIDQL